VIAQLSAAWPRLQVTQEPDEFACFDARVHRQDQLIGLLEIKRRRFHWGQYPSVVLAQSKVLDLVARACLDGCVPVFVVQTNDYTPLYAVDLQRAVGLPVRTNGRTWHVRCAQDHDEPVVDIPALWFGRIR
jgi:hypothetical protein